MPSARAAALGRDEEGPAGLEEVRALIAELAGRLAAEGEGAAAEAAQAAHEERMETLRASLAERTDGGRPRAARRRVAARDHRPARDARAAAPKALVEGSRLDRAILSVPRDGALVRRGRARPRRAGGRRPPARGAAGAADARSSTRSWRPRRCAAAARRSCPMRRRTRASTARPRTSWAGRPTSSRPSRCARPSWRCCTPTAGGRRARAARRLASCGRSRAASPRPTRARACDARCARSAARCASCSPGSTRARGSSRTRASGSCRGARATCR